MYTNRNMFSSMDNALRAFNRIGNELSKGITFETGGFNPRVDILEDSEEIKVIFEIAGVKKEDVSITINDENIISVKGVRNSFSSGESKTTLRKEIVSGEFSRSFQLPDDIDNEKVSAKFNNGVLVVSISKKAPIAPKEYQISIN